MNVRSSGSYVILLYTLDITDIYICTCKISHYIVVSMATGMHADTRLFALLVSNGYKVHTIHYVSLFMDFIVK